jgi:hypothetical protein
MDTFGDSIPPLVETAIDGLNDKIREMLTANAVSQLSCGDKLNAEDIERMVVASLSTARGQVAKCILGESGEKLKRGLGDWHGSVRAAMVELSAAIDAICLVSPPGVIDAGRRLMNATLKCVLVYNEPFRATL